MTVSDNLPGARLLLEQSVIWSLPPGASDSPLIRRLGQGFLCLSTAMLLTWAAELCHDLWVDQEHRVWLPLLVLGALVWCIQVGRLWRSWSAVKPSLRLHWTGDTTEQAHWRVIDWGQPVSIRVACDLQQWLLLEVSSVASSDQPSRSVWSWVRGLDGAAAPMISPVATAHRLRALLYQTTGERAGELDPDGLASNRPAGRQSLASWAQATFPGSNLARSVFSRLNAARLFRKPASGSRAQSWAATEFQPTQWLPREESVYDMAAVPMAQRREFR